MLKSMNTNTKIKSLFNENQFTRFKKNIKNRSKNVTKNLMSSCNKTS